MTDFPPLCGEASTGKTKVWFIRVFGRDGHGIIQTVHGYQGGKMQTNEKRITLGKNVGKRNETTPFEQAELEARATWQKKVDSGYYPSGSAESFYDALEDEPSAMSVAGSAAGSATSAMPMASSSSKAVDVEVPSPMLAHDYNIFPKRPSGHLPPAA